MARRRFDTVHDIDVRNLYLIKLLIVLVLLVACFAAGFLVRGNAAILARLGFEQGPEDAQNPGLTVSGSTYNSLSARVAEVEGILDQKSLDDFDFNATTANVLNEFIASTSDRYLHFYDASHYQAYLQEMSQRYSGFGFLLSEREGAAYVVDVFEGSEAQAKGVREGDAIVAIDGDRGSAGWTQAAATKALTRASGEIATITLRHQASQGSEAGEEYSVSLTSTSSVPDNVTSELSDDVGYIKVSQITQNSDAYVKQAINELSAQGAQAFVLDLRDNPGGYLTQSLDIASLFVKSGTLVKIQSRDGLTERKATGATVTDAPLVVIVNGNTGSTAEVLSAALRDTGRATLVGTRTLGRGSVQSLEELSFGGALRYTSAYYLTPKDVEFDERGIEPDTVVNSTSEVDTQKVLAIESAQASVKG